MCVSVVGKEEQSWQARSAALPYVTTLGFRDANPSTSLAMLLPEDLGRSLPTAQGKWTTGQRPQVVQCLERFEQELSVQPAGIMPSARRVRSCHAVPVR